MDSNRHDPDGGNNTGGLSRPPDLVVVAATVGKVTPERSTENPRPHPSPQRHNRSPPPDDEPVERLAADLLVGAGRIEDYLRTLGVPNPDAYYLRRARRWPIEKHGGYLVASRRQLNHHAEKITAPAA